MSISPRHHDRQLVPFEPRALLFPTVTLLLVLGTCIGVRVNTPIVLGLLVTGVIFLGLPHGALDPLVARKLFHGHRRFTMIRFLICYLLLAIICAASWHAIPDVALCFFLMISAIHFGSDWQERGSRWGRAAYGLCVVSIPTLRYAPEVGQVFTALGATASKEIVNSMRPLAVFAIVLACSSLFRQLRHRNRDALELAVLLVGGLTLSPLTFFVCYFCLLHSPRHLGATSREVGLRSGFEILGAVAPVVFATLGFAALLWRFLPLTDVSSRLLQIVFIGLAALTIPHMLLTALNARAQRPPAEAVPALA